MTRYLGLSEAIRRRRLELGLTLSQLAHRIRSSPATVHRYESGWHRFEIYTLEKLATALGCRLRIDLEPLRPDPPMASRKTVVAQLQRLFWERELEDTDLEDHPGWIVRRVLEMGTLRDVRALIGLMGKQGFLRHLADVRFASEKTSTCWRAMCEQEGTRCTKTSSPRAARISWLR
jgi:transcriptional regulator with XRE-family HTH domain